jgi:hypothetical protein
MTHDQLLLNIDWIIGVHKELPPSVNDSLKALRAAVEVHRPHKIPDWVPTKNEYICDGCTRTYPCPTIQAIEKELI